MKSAHGCTFQMVLQIQKYFIDPMGNVNRRHGKCSLSFHAVFFVTKNISEVSASCKPVESISDTWPAMHISRQGRSKNGMMSHFSSCETTIFKYLSTGNWSSCSLNWSDWSSVNKYVTISESIDATV